MTKAADTIRRAHFINGEIVSGRMLDVLAAIDRVFPGSRSVWWRNSSREKWNKSPQPDGAQRAREIADALETR